MNENLLLSGKIAARSFMGWLSVIVIGGLISFTCLLTAIILWGNNTGPGFAGSRAGGIGALLAVILLFAIEFWTALLFWGAIACMCLYIPLASRYGIQKAIHLSWENKLGDLFVRKADQYLSKILERRSKAPKQATAQEDATLIKKELLLEAKKDPGAGKLQQRIFRYLLKRIRLDGINFSGAPADIRSAILGKIKDMISEKIRPSRKMLWITAGLQLAVLILALVFDHH